MPRERERKVGETSVQRIDRKLPCVQIDLTDHGCAAHLQGRFQNGRQIDPRLFEEKVELRRSPDIAIIPTSNVPHDPLGIQRKTFRIDQKGFDGHLLLAGIDFADEAHGGHGLCLPGQLNAPRANSHIDPRRTDPRAFFQQSADFGVDGQVETRKRCKATLGGDDVGRDDIRERDLQCHVFEKVRGGDAHRNPPCGVTGRAEDLRIQPPLDGVPVPLSRQFFHGQTDGKTVAFAQDIDDTVPQHDRLKALQPVGTACLSAFAPSGVDGPEAADRVRRAQPGCDIALRIFRPGDLTAHDLDIAQRRAPQENILPRCRGAKLVECLENAAGFVIDDDIASRESHRIG